MKKLYNKALIYQAFEKTKWILLVCSFTFFIVCYYFINTKLGKLSSNISNLSTNILSHVDLLIIVLFAVLFF